MGRSSSSEASDDVRNANYAGWTMLDARTFINTISTMNTRHSVVCGYMITI